MALATIEDVERRLEDEPSDRVRVMIDEYLEDASDLARFYGDPNWSEEECPAQVRRIVASAVARFIRNPDAYIASRAADEMLGWSENDEPGTITFTDREIAQIQQLAPPRVGAMGSIPVSSWGTKRRARDEYVPWGHDRRPFPFVAVQHPLHRGRA